MIFHSYVSLPEGKVTQILLLPGSDDSARFPGDQPLASSLTLQTRLARQQSITASNDRMIFMRHGRLGWGVHDIPPSLRVTYLVYIME